MILIALLCCKIQDIANKDCYTCNTDPAEAGFVKGQFVAQIAKEGQLQSCGIQRIDHANNGSTTNGHGIQKENGNENGH